MPPSQRVVYAVRRKPKRPFPRWFLYFLAAVAAAAILGWGFWYGANLPYFRVSRIEVKDAAMLSPTEIEQEVRDGISGKRFFVLPADNFFLVSEYGLSERLKEKFPQLSTAEVTRVFPSGLTVRVEGRKLWGIYCNRPVATQPPVTCFYVDTRGMAYDEISGFSGWLLPVVYSARGVGAGSEAVPAAVRSFFESAAGAFSDLRLNLLWVTLSTSTPDGVRLGLDEGWEVWASTTRPVAEWAGALKMVLEQEIGDKRSRLEYVDVRLGNKVFYKLR